MNLSESLVIDKELFSGDQSSYENIFNYISINIFNK